MRGVLALAAALAAVVCAVPAISAAARPPGCLSVADMRASALDSGSAVARTAPSAGFSWTDAGIGAGVGIGALLVLTGGALVLDRARGGTKT
jgi:hypothetical protein